MTMTNFFGINLKDDNMRYDGDVFTAREFSEAQQEQVEDLQTKGDAIRKKVEIPFIFSLLRFACLLAVVFAFCCICGNEFDFALCFKDKPLLLIAGAVGLVVGVLLIIFGNRRIKKGEATDEYKAYISNTDEYSIKIRQILNIPENAQSIDALCEFYSIKNGEVKHKKIATTQYNNLDLFVYEQNGNICFASDERVWEIPVFSFKSIELLKKRATFSVFEWNKKEDYDSPKYKPYKVNEKNSVISTKVYRIEISDIKGRFYLLIPIYDGDIIMSLTHLHPLQEL